MKDKTSIKEEWKPMPEFEGRYEVSNYGRVRSLFKPSGYGLREREVPKIRKIFTGRYGEQVVRLKHGDFRKNVKIHRAVAIAFIPNPKNKPEVNHINSDRSDNHVTNLEWCTRSENMAHASKNGLMPIGEKNHLSKLTKQEAAEIKRLLKNGRLTQREIADRYDIDPSTVSYINTGKTWAHVSAD